MRFKEYQFTPKKRRGLSSVVGALLFVVLMVATFAVLGVALDSQTDIVDTGRDVANIGLEKQQEDFILNSVVQTSGNFLQVNATNKGQNVAEIFTMVITNSTDIANGFPTNTYEIPSETSFLSPGKDASTNVVETLDLTLTVPGSGTSNYEIKIISSLGTIKKITLVCDSATDSCGPGTGGGIGSLAVQLLLDGPNGINTKNSTAIMFVTNTGDVKLKDVTPVNSCASMFFEVQDQAGLGAVDPCVLKPNTPDTLAVGQTILFAYDMEIAGDINDEFRFCNGVTAVTDPDGDAVPPSNIDCDELTVIDPNDCGGCGPGGTTIILIDDLLIRPSLFMIIPSPFGDTDGNKNYKDGIWGVNVANPTEKDMKISKLTIVAYPPGANNLDVVFNDNSCLISGISPADDWSCPRLNTILWQNFTSPITIPSYSSQSFMAQLEPGSISGNADVDALIVQANAFTTTGSFGKSSYQSTMFDTPESVVNIFLTSTPGSRTDIQSDRLTLDELVPETFQITLADMDDDDTTYIKSGAKLVINVPREWTDVCIQGDESAWVANGTPDPDCTIDDRITFFGDLSHQIIVESVVDLGGDIGGNDLADAITLEFTVTPKENEAGFVDQLYLMYVLADGLTGNENKIGPLNEIVLQVNVP